MDCYSKDLITTSLSPTWPLNESTALQKKVKKLAYLCGIPSADIIKNSLLQREGAYLNFPINKDIAHDAQRAKTSKSSRRKISAKSSKLKFASPKLLQAETREISPGYVYSRNADKVHVTLTDAFWKREIPTQKETYVVDDNEYNRELVTHLKSELDQLKILIEAERFVHKTSTIKNRDDFIREKQIIHEHHIEHIQAIETDQVAEVQAIKGIHQEEIEEITSRFDFEQKKLKDELNFLNEKFESHKTFVNDEMGRKWQSKEDKLIYDMEEKTQQLLTLQKKELTKEKNYALDGMTTDNNKHLMNVMEQHQNETDKLLRKFASSANDADKLKLALKELDVLKEKNTDMKNKLSETSEKLRKTENELADVKVKLGGFENNFTEKVAEVEERYTTRIDDLTKENLDLRRKYLHKCEELHSAHMKKDAKQMDATVEAKDLMQSVILSCTRTNVSLTAARALPDAVSPQNSAKKKEHPRRFSQPVTNSEQYNALTDAAESKRPPEKGGSLLRTESLAHISQGRLRSKSTMEKLPLIDEFNLQISTVKGRAGSVYLPPP